MLLRFKNFLRRLFSRKKIVIDQRSQIGGDDNSVGKMNVGRDINSNLEKSNERD